LYQSAEYRLAESSSDDDGIIIERRRSLCGLGLLMRPVYFDALNPNEWTGKFSSSDGPSTIIEGNRKLRAIYPLLTGKYWKRLCGGSKSICRGGYAFPIIPLSPYLFCKRPSLTLLRRTKHEPRGEILLLKQSVLGDIGAPAV
jgi:hypothetical protein